MKRRDISGNTICLTGLVSPLFNMSFLVRSFETLLRVVPWLELEFELKAPAPSINHYSRFRFQESLHLNIHSNKKKTRNVPVIVVNV